MGLSRLAPLILLAAVPAGAISAPPITAEQAMTNYRKVIKTTRELDCPRGSSDEIVVCGNRDGEARTGRLPLPFDRNPGERISGEPLADGGGCISRCHQPVMVPLHKIPGFIGRVIERLKDN
jgi:hypothetical protein